MNITLKKIVPALLSLVLVVFTWSLYEPGISGGFLFDDYVNLEPLGAFGGVYDFENAKSFILSGFSGPTGRPLSLATFLLDDNDWPSNGSWFKATNIKIHLLCGLLLMWATFLIARIWGRSESQASWLAVISAGIWLLHPYQVSTVLYVIQRMAQLSALFVFLGLVFYLKGRMLLPSRPLQAYILMTLGVGGCTLLGVLSKENGALLPLLILIVEWSVRERRYPHNNPHPLWLFTVLGVPSLIVLGYLVSKFSLIDSQMGGRLFTQHERLMSEARIVCEYLYHIFVPRIEGRGLFQDGYTISRGLFEPVTTLYSILALMLLVIASFVLKKKYPSVFLAFGFFFVAHIMESTWLNLELYFEHRNYVASAFLFFPLAIFFVDLKKHINPKLIPILVLVVFSVLAFFTHKRVGLWSDTDSLELYWAASTPESARAQNRVTGLLFNMGKINEAVAHIEEQDRKFGNSSLLTVNHLFIKVYVEIATEQDFLTSSERMIHQPFDAQAIKGLRSMVETLESRKGKHDADYAKYTIQVLDALRNNENYINSSVFNRVFHYLKAKLYVVMGMYQEAYENYLRAMHMYKETDAALSMVAEMGRAGQPEKALKLLKVAEDIYQNQNLRTLKRSASIYDYEFDRIQSLLENEIHD